MSKDHRAKDDAQHSAPHGPALARICDTLRELRELTEERAARLASLDAARDESTREAQVRFENDTVHAKQDLDGTRHAVWNEERARHDEIAQQFDGIIKKQHDERAALLHDADEKAASKLEKINQEAVESRWLLMTVHDSDVAQAHDLARKRLETLDSIRHAVAEAMQARVDLRRDLHLPEAPHLEEDADAPSVETVERGIEDATHAIDQARSALHKLSSSPLPRLARGAGYVVFVIVLVIAGGAGGFFLDDLAFSSFFLVGLVVGTGIGVGCRFLFIRTADALAEIQDDRCAVSIRDAGALELASRQLATSELKDRLDGIDTKTGQERESIEHKANERRDTLERQRVERRKEIHDRYTPKIERLEQERDEKRQQATARRQSIEAQAQERYDRVTADARAVRDRAIAEAVSIAEAGRRELDFRWREAEPRLRQECETLRQAGERHAPAWDATSANPDPVPPALTRIGWARWDVPEAAAGKPIDWSGARTIALPIPLEFPRVGSLYIEAEAQRRHDALGIMRAVMLRLLTTVPPGKLRFTILDPIGLGESFAAFMHLADHQDALVSGRIWTEPRHIEQRLLDLTEHMESVIQKYLRNDFPTIESYNQAAGEIAEPYRYLVVADFPTNISESAAKRIASIVASGSRCGVHTIILRSPFKDPPKAITVDDLRSNALTIKLENDGTHELVGHEPFAHARVEFDAMPDESRTRDLLTQVGEGSIDAGRVQVPFAAVGPGEGEGWTRSSADVLRIPIGRSGASKIQELVLGEGTAQHALIAGRTGSGKSTLFHVIVTSTASWYAPDEVELYLVDFKKGVEFKPYATHRLPHARVIAIETDRAFGLSVLQRVDAELTERGEKLRNVEAQSLTSYREKTGERMPRVLLIVDEFQELFVEDDAIAQQSAMLLDRIVRQGRAFGVHVVLGSQTLGGAYAINRATMSQMNVRVALQCDEQDSYIILGEDNAAARLLERPGEAVYNAQGGKVEANSPFQVVWLPDTVRDEAIARIATKAGASGLLPSPPVVFEGNAPADPMATPELVTSRTTPLGAHDPVPVHLGVPVAIAPPLTARLERGRAENLLVLSSNADSARAMLATSLLGFSNAADATPGAVAYVVHARRDEDARSLGAIAEHVGLDTRVSEVGDISQTLIEIDAEVERRALGDASNEPPLLVVLAGIHLCRDVRKGDDLGFTSFSDEAPKAKSSGELLDDLIQRGPELGVHTLLWVDTLDAFERALDRRRMADFAHRVLTQMNAMDSSAVLDSPEASRLARGRALYYSDRAVESVVFRPYAFPAM